MVQGSARCMTSRSWQPTDSLRPNTTGEKRVLRPDGLLVEICHTSGEPTKPFESMGALDYTTLDFRFALFPAELALRLELCGLRC